MKKSTIIKYSVSILVSALAVVLILSLKSFSFNRALIEVYRDLADAFTIVGVLVLGIGALVWVSTTGLFDGLGYVMKHTIGMLIPGYKKKDQKYYDYKVEKDEKRATGYGFLLVVGAIFFLIAIVFTVLFFQVS